ncbi:hypothetical protein BX616_010390 [Lobosporangium transversale]|nr:hypothetical protein BX616_010390 [Lobosporangium transversale]
MFASRISQFSVFSVLPKASGTSSARYITKSIYAAERPEGMGAIVRRSLGTREMRHHDPFLLLDEFYLNPEKSGFPDHPHRGFETVTYMLRGQMQHEDFSGHKGTIGPGDLQWMTAGRGIVHCEMPIKDQAKKGNQELEQKEFIETKKIEKEEEEEDMIHGLQLWVNLSHADKLCEPAYQGLRDSQIPRARPSEGVEVKIIAGEAHGVQSRVYTRTPTMYLDYQMKKNKSVDVNIPRDYNGFIYMLSGRAYFGDRGSAANIVTTSIQASSKASGNGESRSYIEENTDPSKPFEGRPHCALILSKSNNDDDDSNIKIDSSNNSTLHIQIKDESTHFVVLAGRPLKEPVVQDRLFVLNSKEEVKQTLEDYREFKNGFENAKQWRSTIGPRAYRLKF